MVKAVLLVLLTVPLSAALNAVMSTKQQVHEPLLTRRGFAAAAAAAAVAMAPSLALATTSTTVINSALNGYGLPSISPTPGFTSNLWTDQQQPGVKVLMALSYPKEWVESPQGREVGAADYKNGDGVRVVVKALPPGATADAASLDTDFIAVATLPGDSQRSAPEYRRGVEQSWSPETVRRTVSIASSSRLSHAGESGGTHYCCMNCTLWPAIKRSTLILDHALATLPDAPHAAAMTSNGTPMLARRSLATTCEYAGRQAHFVVGGTGSFVNLC